jgi:hypothetical protein
MTSEVGPTLLRLHGFDQYHLQVVGKGTPKTGGNFMSKALKLRNKITRSTGAMGSTITPPPRPVGPHSTKN